MNGQIDERAAGVLLGMGVADGWSTATELALCVGDAAATGLALTDASALGLLERNLRELRLENGSAGRASSSDETLAAAAVVALAHLRDTAAVRADATRAVLAVLDSQTVVGDEMLRWVELVAGTVLGGALVDGQTDASADQSADPSASATAASIAAAVRAVGAAEGAAEGAAGTDSVRFAVGLAAGTAAPAATGALLGARFGWRAVPSELADQAKGWPGADANELIGIGLLAVRERSRSAPDGADRSGGPLPIEHWEEAAENAEDTTTPHTTTPAAEPAGDGGSSAVAWRRSQVVLTTGDADTTAEQAHDGRAGA